VADGLLRLIEFFVQQGQVVMAIRKLGILAQRSFVRLHRLLLAARVVEQHAEVEEKQWIIAAG